jgi:sugar phosphate isomerase/epimerase
MPKFGLSSNHLNANLTQTEEFLRQVAEVGFDCYELELTNLSLMTNRRWIPPRKRDFVEVLNSIPLEYSLHLPLFMDLGEENNNYQDFFKSFVEIALELRIHDLVLHPSKRRSYFADSVEMQRLKTLAPLLRDSGIRVHLENLLNQAHDGAYSYNIPLGDNLRMLQQLDEECYGYCFDSGHAFITTRFREENIAEEYEKIRDSVTHLHLHDNFGKVPDGDKKISRHEALMLGYGDLHLPPTWGEIPFPELTPLFNGYEGRVIVELFKDYLDDLPGILETTRGLFIPSPK